MDLGLSGRSAVITGGRAGIGAATVRVLAGEGCDVAIVDLVIDEQVEVLLEDVRGADRRAVGIAADVRDSGRAERAVQEAVERLGRLDILVCSAGITRDGVAWKLGDEDWEAVLAVNLSGAFHYNRAAARVFRGQRSGRIVNIASINGLRGKAGQTNYCASKGGMIAMSKALARELGRYDVTVNVVAPGMVRTDMTDRLPPEVRQRAADEAALGRIADPADCAGVIAFLCSDRARHVTGAVIQVDGGQYM